MDFGGEVGLRVIEFGEARLPLQVG
jgi:hypothetical protein